MTAEKLLKKIVQQKMWHKGLLGSTGTASVYKTMIVRGTLGYKTQCAILEKLGHKKVSSEKWV